MTASNLTHYKVFFNSRFQLRTIVGSSKDVVVVAFRGSAVAANFWTDAQVRARGGEKRLVRAI